MSKTMTRDQFVAAVADLTAQTPEYVRDAIVSMSDLEIGKIDPPIKKAVRLVSFHAQDEIKRKDQRKIP